MALRAQPPSPATAKFPATRRAGAATDVALRIRRHGRLNLRQVERFAEAAALDVSDLRLSLLPLLAEGGVIELRRSDGTIVRIEEFVGVASPVLEQCAQMWTHASPGLAESCCIEIADRCTYVPCSRSELGEELTALGLEEEHHDRVLAMLSAVGLLRRQPSTALGEDIYYSPYVWGNDAVNIAEFMARLPPNEREVLANIARVSSERPGTTVDHFEADPSLLRGARKVGLIDATRVITKGGSDKAFAFPPGLEHRIGGGSTDATHERKLFTAHIMFGHQYGYPGTGRIRDPLVLVNALINRGRVGPTTSIRTDYPLLEGQGIVRVEQLRSGRAYLHLVKEDVARDSLELLRLALEEEPSGTDSGDPLDSLWVPGALFRGPEQDRAALPEPDPGATTEVLTSTIEQLREEQQRRIRGEEP